MIGIVLDQLPIGPVPQTQFTASSCCEQVTIGTPGKMLYPGGASWEFETLLPALGVPESDLSILSDTGEYGAARIPGNFSLSKGIPIKYMQHLPSFASKDGDWTTY